jgi:hypothetical protein
VAAALGLRTRQALLVVGMINVLTNPALNYALIVAAKLAPAGHELRVVVLVLAAGEVIVWLAEWRLLLWTLGGGQRRMLMLSGAMNAASLAVGLLVFWT